MAVNLSNSPYYDDYDSSKNYTGVLTIPGRVAQAREINQIQTTLKDHIGRLGDAIFSNGSIISGCLPTSNLYTEELPIISCGKS